MNKTITIITCDFCGKDISKFVPFQVVQEMDVRDGNSCYHLYLGVHFCDKTCFLNRVTDYFNQAVK